jgi:hypothetical protein
MHVNAQTTQQLLPNSYDNSVKELPSEISDGVDDSVSDSVLAELLRLHRVKTKLGDMAEAFNENPSVLALAVESNSTTADLFRQYINTDDSNLYSTIETQLLQLY